tara:strand:- start:109 stop:465 length:357 start_codon:yes stop_codon:yes gene_type:complete
MVKKYRKKHKTRKKSEKTDVFGKRTWLPIEHKIALKKIDNLILASDMDNKNKVKRYMIMEYKRRLKLLLKPKKTRRLFNKLTKKKNKNIKKMSIKRVERLYYKLLKDQKKKTKKLYKK